MPLPPTMRAQVLTTFSTPYTLTTLPLPSSPTTHDILLRIHAASYCHTDLVYASGAMGRTLPLIGSHEFAGVAISLGSLASTSSNDIQIGTRVGVPGRAYRPCGKCWECTHTSDVQGYSVYCPKAGNNGITRDGGFCEYAIVDSRQVVPIPSSLSFVDTAPLMCAGLTVWEALKRCGLEKGEVVGIVGAGGGLGHLGVQFARRMGLGVVGVEREDGALGVARECLGDVGEGQGIFDARIVRPREIVDGLPGAGGLLEVERGVGAVLVLPESQAAFEYGMGLLRPHGTCVVVSFPEGGFRVSARDLVFRDVRVVGSLVGSNGCAREMLDVAARTGVRAKVKTFALEDLNELVEEYKKGGGGKLVVDMDMGR